MTISRSIRRPLALVGISAFAAVAAGGLTAGPAAAAEGKIRSAGTAEVVKDSYVVVLKDKASVSSKVSSLQDKYGGKVGRTYRHAIGGFEVKLSEKAAKRLAADPRVAYVEENGIFTTQETQQNATWGIDRIDQRALPLSTTYTYDTTASNVTAYIIDTGVRLTHREFGGRATWGTNTTGDGNNTDCQGHGTHVAGTVGGSTYGVAKAVKIVAVKVLGCNGSGTNAGVIAGVDWVTQNAVKPAVANMSLGGGASSAVDSAVARSVAAGITYAVASGNSNTNACNSSPAREPSAITVNASERGDARSSFSNFGTCTDIFAPGTGITAAWITNDTATNTISGTSMASPHVAGAAALVLAGNPGFTPAQVTSRLTSTATANAVTNAGSGSPNRLLFTGAGGGTTPPPTTPPTTPPPSGGSCTGSNGTDVAIPDAGAAVTSTITISGCNRNAGASSTVAVTVPHTFRGDVVLDLVAPDGTAYRIKNSSANDSADNVNGTATVNLSSEAANGAWRLRAQDVYRTDTGRIDTWTLTL